MGKYASIPLNMIEYAGIYLIKQSTEYARILNVSDAVHIKVTTNYWAVIETRDVLTLFRMGFFGATHGWGEGPKRPSLPKICHTYPAMMKLGTVIPYPKKIQKIYESRDAPLDLCWHQHFFTGNQQILLYQEIQI